VDEVTREALARLVADSRVHFRAQGYRFMQAVFGWCVSLADALGDLSYREIRQALRQQVLEEFERHFPDQDADS